MHVAHEHAENMNSCSSDFRREFEHIQDLDHIRALHFTIALKASRHTFLFISSKHCPSSVIYTPTSGAP